MVTIRDAQLNEKKVIQKERLEEERRLDTIMEVERLKALKMYEEREHRRKEDQKNGATVIITQMRERERERVRQLELQDQEREAMLRQNHEMKEEEMRQVRDMHACWGAVGNRTAPCRGTPPLPGIWEAAY